MASNMRVCTLTSNGECVTVTNVMPACLADRLDLSQTPGINSKLRLPPGYYFSPLSMLLLQLPWRFVLRRFDFWPSYPATCLRFLPLFQS